MLAEFRSATRGLVRWRGSAVAVLTLAAGIGAAMGLYAVAQVLLADLPGVPALERVGRIYASNPTLGVQRGRIAINEFDSGLGSAASFAAVGAYADEDAVLGSGPEARAVIAGYASPAFFTAMGVPPVAGRVFTAADLTGPPVIVLSDALWRRQFPNKSLAGATLLVDGVERAIVGVMPAAFHYPFVGMSADLWIPLQRAGRDRPSIVGVYARLRDGVDWTSAQAELTVHSRAAAPWTLKAIPIVEDTRSRAVAAYAGTLGPAALVLLIACVNVACLLMARGVARGPELAARRALGATRWDLARLLLLEHLVLAIAGGALGALFAGVIVRAIASQLAVFQPALAAALPDGLRLLPAALAVSTLACLLFGTAPALRLSGRGVAAPPIKGYGARDLVIFAEVACSVGFVVWTALLYTLYAGLHAIAPAFPADHVVAMRVRASGAVAAAARVAAVPGVTHTAVSSGMIGGGSRERVQAGGTPTIVSRIPVGDGFFDALGIRIVSGRAFDAAELKAQADVAIIGETAARRLAPHGQAIGLTLHMTGRPDATVIGVCRDAIDYGVLADVDAVAGEMYVPYEPSVSSPEAVVLARLAGDAHAGLGAIAAAAGTPPGTRPARPVVLSDEFAKRDSASGLAAVRALGWFSLLTLVLAASGVFAVINQSMAQRTREFGIRLAIGATPARVLGAVLAREVRLIAAAMATGVAFTLMATRTLFVELVTLGTIAPSMWLAGLFLSGGVAAMAVAFATHRVVRLEPSAVLRRD